MHASIRHVDHQQLRHLPSLLRSWMIRGVMLTGMIFSGMNTYAEDETPAVPTAEELKSALSNQLLILNVSVSQRAPSVSLYSKRGDVQFFLGNISAALADYQEMLKIDPQLGPSHWRLGIALYFDGKHAEAARQFARYYDIDKVDRENGIWQYFSQVKAIGLEPARAQIFPYEMKDREPFGAIYDLISGKISGDQLLDQIEKKNLTPEDRQNQMFYGELYIGLNDAVLGNTQSAREHLQKAVANPWPLTAGYGPHYMWHVGRIQLQQLEQPKPAP